MGKFFSDAVETALKYIYYQERQGKGWEGLQLLQQASAAGDGDASCILARCLCGPQYVWQGHGFPEDDEKATLLYHKGVEEGSALAALICLRTGDMTPSLEKKMPFASLQEAFNVVLEKAKGGEPFCQFVIGNVYFWGDYIRIENKGPDTFPNMNAFRDYIVESIPKCEDWFLKAYRNGVYAAGDNLHHFYEEGEEGLIPPQPEKAKGLYRIGAEMGHPIHQFYWGNELNEAGQKQEALHWYQEALDGGEMRAMYQIGCLYEEGEAVPQDYAKAAQCYEATLDLQGYSIGSHNRLGAMYFNGKGVPQDYAKAFQLLSWAYDQDSRWGVFYLGKCCFYGLGARQDYTQARTYLEEMTWENKEANYMLGYIYARGLGVPADIKKGVALLQKAGDRTDAKEELLRYRKTFFGKWVVR